MYQACFTLWSYPHFLFGVALYAALTWLPNWPRIASWSMVITLVAAVVWEFLEAGGERLVRNRPKVAWTMTDRQGRGESLCNQVVDVVVALVGHGMLQFATRSRARLHLGVVCGIWLVWLAFTVAVLLKMRRQYYSEDADGRS